MALNKVVFPDPAGPVTKKFLLERAKFRIASRSDVAHRADDARASRTKPSDRCTRMESKVFGETADRNTAWTRSLSMPATESGSKTLPNSAEGSVEPASSVAFNDTSVIGLEMSKCLSPRSTKVLAMESSSLGETVRFGRRRRPRPASANQRSGPLQTTSVIFGSTSKPTSFESASKGGWLRSESCIPRCCPEFSRGSHRQ